MDQRGTNMFRCQNTFFSTKHVRWTLIFLTFWAIVVGLYLHGSEIYSTVFFGRAKAEVSQMSMRWEKSPKGCMFPRTDPFDPSIVKVIRKWSPLDCSKERANVVFMEKFSVLKVNLSKIHLVLSPGSKFSHCLYRELALRKNNDKSFQIVWTSKAFNDSVPIPTWHENLVAECFDTSNKVISKSYFSLIRRKPETERLLAQNYKNHLQKNNPSEIFNIFIIGMDGMSKQNFERTMPKTRNYLLKNMSAVEFNKYVKVGQNTLPNVLVLLTGRTVTELKTQYGYTVTGFQDEINTALVWSEARDLGYRTGLTLDWDYITAFHYLKKGFRVPPVDYYQRATVVASCRDSLMRAQDGNCLGDQPEMTHLYDYWLQMAATFGKNPRTPFLAFSFAARLTHDDCGRAASGDDVYFKFLADLAATGAMNNTILVWFSDHGQRYGLNRKTYNGRIETNTPFLFLTFPSWFKEKYPEKWEILRQNQNRLTTHFDVYETIRDLLYFKTENKAKGTAQERNISLFREIPIERTCDNAGIPESYCVCGQLSTPDMNKEERDRLGQILLSRINSYIESYKPKHSSASPVRNPNVSQVRRNLRVSSDALKYGLNQTLNSSFGLTNSNIGNSNAVLLKFNASKSSDRLETRRALNTSGDSSKSESVISRGTCSHLSLIKVENVLQVTNSELKTMKAKTYKVTISTSPGAGLFEGMVNYEMKKGGHAVSDIVRINMYRGQAECVQDPWLRQFCYCL